MQYSINTRKKDKGIQYIISYKDINGKWKQRSKQGFKNTREAKAAADLELDKLKKNLELQTDLNQEHEGITFKEFSDMFVEHEKLYKEPNTIRTYHFAIQKFQRIYNTKLSEIRNIELQYCIDDMVKEGLDITTIKSYVVKIGVIFNKALNQYKLIVKTPMENLNIPKRKNETIKRALTKAEVSELLSKITKRKYYIASLLAVTCGLRLSEILGLTWSDINKDNTLSINKQWKKNKDGKFDFGTLKSKNSKRTVPIPPTTLKELIKYKKETPTDINNRIIQYTDSINFSRMLRETFGKLGYKISLHELRHTYATMLISSGIDFKTAAKLLGHDIEQTMKTYSHVTDDMLNRATDVIKQIF